MEGAVRYVRYSPSQAALTVVTLNLVPYRHIRILALAVLLATNCCTAASPDQGLCEKESDTCDYLPTLDRRIIKMERTFLALKPDAVQRGLIGNIVSRFETRGFKLVAMKFMIPTPALLKEHYADLATKPFFPGLVEYMASGPVVAMVWEGKDMVKQGRQMLGETNPLASLPGSIRGDYSIDIGRNICHGSDSVDSANKEIALWFKPEELCTYKRAVDAWIYE